MKPTIEQYVTALREALNEVRPESVDLVLENFVRVLAQHGDTDKYATIVHEYEMSLAGKEPLIRAQVTAADTAVIDRALADELNRIAAQRLQIEESVDPALIGGVVVRIDDTIIDASVRGSLEQLRKTLII